MDSMRAIQSGSRITAGILLLGALALATPAARAQESAPPPAADTTATKTTAAAAAPATALGCADGEKDAKAAPAPWGYEVAGLLTGPIGFGFAAMHTPQPSASRLEFAGAGAEEYARCYGRTMKKANVKAAANGFAIGVLAVAIVIFYQDSKTAP